jgi:hypothetical protein
MYNKKENHKNNPKKFNRRKNYSIDPNKQEKDSIKII